jgi:hypothetical protein
VISLARLVEDFATAIQRADGRRPVPLQNVPSVLTCGFGMPLCRTVVLVDHAAEDLPALH